VGDHIQADNANPGATGMNVTLTVSTQVRRNVNAANATLAMQANVNVGTASDISGRSLVVTPIRIG
jgi:hypothetical protein